MLSKLTVSQNSAIRLHKDLVNALDIGQNIPTSEDNKADGSGRGILINSKTSLTSADEHQIGIGEDLKDRLCQEILDLIPKVENMGDNLSKIVNNASLWEAYRKEAKKAQNAKKTEKEAKKCTEEKVQQQQQVIKPSFVNEYETSPEKRHRKKSIEESNLAFNRIPNKSKTIPIILQKQTEPTTQVTILKAPNRTSPWQTNEESSPAPKKPIPQLVESSPDKSPLYKFDYPSLSESVKLPKGSSPQPKTPIKIPITPSCSESAPRPSVSHNVVGGTDSIYKPLHSIDHQFDTNSTLFGSPQQFSDLTSPLWPSPEQIYPQYNQIETNYERNLPNNSLWSFPPTMPNQQSPHVATSASSHNIPTWNSFNDTHNFYNSDIFVPIDSISGNSRNRNLEGAGVFYESYGSYNNTVNEGFDSSLYEEIPQHHQYKQFNDQGLGLRTVRQPCAVCGEESMFECNFCATLRKRGLPKPPTFFCSEHLSSSYWKEHQKVHEQQ